MKKTLFVVAVGLLAIAAQAAEIKVTIGGGSEPAKEYAFVPTNTPYVIDQRVPKKYESHVGCKNFDTSKLHSQVDVGRKVQIAQEGKFEDGVFLSIRSENTELKGLSPHSVKADCVVNNYTAHMQSSDSHIFLKRGEPFQLEPNVQLLLN